MLVLPQDSFSYPVYKLLTTRLDQIPRIRGIKDHRSSVAILSHCPPKRHLLISGSFMGWLVNGLVRRSLFPSLADVIPRTPPCDWLCLLESGPLPLFNQVPRLDAGRAATPTASPHLQMRLSTITEPSTRERTLVMCSMYLISTLRDQITSSRNLIVCTPRMAESRRNDSLFTHRP